MTNAKHTPTPWKVGGAGDTGIFATDVHPITKEIDEAVYIAEIMDAAIDDGTGGLDSVDEERWRANAAYIVKAVNCHERLVEALKNIQHILDSDKVRGMSIHQDIPNAMLAIQYALAAAEAA